MAGLVDSTGRQIAARQLLNDASVVQINAHPTEGTELNLGPRIVVFPPGSAYIVLSLPHFLALKGSEARLGDTQANLKRCQAAMARLNIDLPGPPPAKRQ